MSENNTYNKLIEYLKDFISIERFDRINEVLDQRTNHLTIVLEDLHKAHNANAVLRSCDGFGIQDVHIIENQNEFDSAGTVSIGAHNWLTLHRYNSETENNIDRCFNDLRDQGYQIIATTPHEQDSNIDQLDITKRTALVFGTELEGVSEEVTEKVEGFVKIPMYGFSESFNISVSAAICMFELTKRIRSSNNDWHLMDDYKTKLRYQWIKQTIKAGDQLVAKFLNENDLRLPG
ncbi:MAG: TrmH family RNA methyltransferase [Balneolaceae bacterium]